VTLVVDASVAVRWFFELEGSDRAERVLRSDQPLVAPDLIIAEITNAAWKLVTFDGVPAHAASAILREAAKPFDELVPSGELKDRAFAIAFELSHAAYDCFYIALAELRRTRVVTADDRLVRRCAGTRFAELVTAMP
jgi:predicted nucleic acid-binding protein